MPIMIDVDFNPDGSYRSAAEHSGNQSKRVKGANHNELVAKAMGAIQKCSPLKMPAGKYDKWKRLTFGYGSGEYSYRPVVMSPEVADSMIGFDNAGPMPDGGYMPEKYNVLIWKDQ
jgi:hypothetical protein